MLRGTDGVVREIYRYEYEIEDLNRAQGYRGKLRALLVPLKFNVIS